MLKLWQCALPFILLGLSACGTPRPPVDPVDQAFLGRLNERLTGYDVDAARTDAVLSQETAPAAITADEASAQDNGAAVKIAHDVYRSAELHARSVMLNVFLLQAAPSGKPAVMSDWLSRERTASLAKQQQMAGMTEAFKQESRNEPWSPALASDYLILVKQRGNVDGAAEELDTIGKDIRAYGTS